MKAPTAFFIFMCITIACSGCGFGAKENEDKPKNFGALYSTNCSGCHGADGKFGPARMLNSPVYLAILPKEELRNVIENGRPGTAMPAFATSQGGQLTDEEISMLVDGMEKQWAKPAHFGSKTPPPYNEPGGGDSKAGAALFAGSCAICHREKGVTGPVDIPAYLALASDQLLRAMMLAGRPDLGMPDWRVLNRGKPLSGQDVSDIVAYLASKRASPRAAGGVSAGDNEQKKVEPKQ